jgi:3-oxoacyl-[acyl-carrier-protein] synthase II
MAPALVTGIGVVGPCGHGPEALWRALMSGGSDRRAITHFPTHGSQLATAGLVPGEEHRAGAPNRVLELLMAAADEALADAGIEDRVDVALVAATTDAGGNALATGRVTDARSPLQQPAAAFGGWLAPRAAEQLGLRGQALTISTASASGGCALCVAQDLLAAGDARTVLVAGADCVTESAFHGLRSLRTLSAEGCRPFNAERRGIGISEGAAALVLETAVAGPHRPAYAQLAGCATSNVTSHLVSPSAHGIAHALAAALAAAEIDPSTVELINAHGSGTRAGDLAEVEALRSLFGGRIGTIAIMSAKGTLGHWQGAAGVVEALACVLSLSRHVITPAHGAEPIDDAWSDLDIVLAPRPAKLRTAVSISSGLGGVNAAAVFTAAP